MFSFLPASGAGLATIQLAKAKPVFPLIKALDGKRTPAFDGSFDDLLAKDASLAVQLHNKVKRCVCGKPNAFTLKTCNSCGASLADTPLSSTNNVFMGFIYGLKGLPISLRFESPSILCFDDLLQLSAAHLNCIPTTAYIPDWRSLLTRPTEGLRLLEQLYDTCWKVVEAQFYADPQWRATFLKGNVSLDELKQHCAVGFNYPPSQYQLHLQFMVFPLQPFQYQMYLKGVHYTVGRFFPIEYARAVLALDQPLPTAASMDIEEIIAFFRARGINYEAVHTACYTRYGASHQTVANYSPGQFRAALVDDTTLVDLETGEEVKGAIVKDIIAEDKAQMQSYGHPMKEGNFNVSYYSFAKAQAVPDF